MQQTDDAGSAYAHVKALLSSDDPDRKTIVERRLECHPSTDSFCDEQRTHPNPVTGYAA